MNRNVKGVIYFLVAAVASYFLVVFVTPTFILAVVKAKTKSEFNVPVYTKVITDKNRDIVLPNPDFLYVVCGYNVWEGPLKITGTMTDSSYYSLSLYSGNTKNYYIKNNQSATEKEFEIILTNKDGGATINNEGLECITSPSYFGFIIVRILIDNTHNLQKLQEIQSSFKVEELKNK